MREIEKKAGTLKIFASMDMCVGARERENSRDRTVERKRERERERERENSRERTVKREIERVQVFVREEIYSE